LQILGNTIIENKQRYLERLIIDILIFKYSINFVDNNMKKLTHLIKNLQEKNKQFPLRHKILNISTLWAVIISILTLISNYLFTLHEALLISIFSFFFFSIVLILSFKTKNYDRIIVLALIGTILIILPATWFVSGGASGGTVYFFFVSIIVSFVLGYDKKVFFIALSIIVLLSLLSIEYLYPDLLINYEDALFRYIDIAIYATISLLISIYYLNIYYKKYERANKKLIQKTKNLERINETKDKLYSIIAHDLKNPFNIMIGFSNLIYHDIQNKNYKNLKEYSKYLLDISEQSYDLLLNLLDWSRANYMEIKYHPEKVDLSELFNEQIKFFSHIAKTKKNQIILNLDECIIHTDINILNTLIRNLISNAIKFTENGTITISAKREDDFCEISVEDSGIGINPEVLNNLFSSNKTTQGTQGELGTGIGLQLCYDFTKMLNSHLNVRSQLGRGSTFSFKLPLYHNNN